MVHMIGSHIESGFVDKRRAQGTNRSDVNSHMSLGPTVFTANAGGTTTTIVGANAAPGTNDTNVIRRGEKFRLFNSSGVLKEETVFEVTTIAVGASTTVTFSPAAAVSTASGDFAKLISVDPIMDEENLDSRLTALNPTSYTTARLNQMTTNDKIFAIRVETDLGGI